MYLTLKYSLTAPKIKEEYSPPTADFDGDVKVVQNIKKKSNSNMHKVILYIKFQIMQNVGSQIRSKKYS